MGVKNENTQSKVLNMLARANQAKFFGDHAIATILVTDAYDGDKVAGIINHRDSNVRALIDAIKPANTRKYGMVLNYVFMYSIARKMHEAGCPDDDDTWILQTVDEALQR